MCAYAAVFLSLFNCHIKRLTVFGSVFRGTITCLMDSYSFRARPEEYVDICLCHLAVKPAGVVVGKRHIVGKMTVRGYL